MPTFTGEWASYFEDVDAQRKRLMNVVSLQLAGTALQACILLAYVTAGDA